MATVIGTAMKSIQDHILGVMKDLDDEERDQIIQEIPVFCDEMSYNLEDGTFDDKLY